MTGRSRSRHVIFPVFGYVTNLERLKAGKIHWAWDRNAPTMFGILPRNGEAQRHALVQGPREGHRPHVQRAHRREHGDPGSADLRQQPVPILPVRRRIEVGSRQSARVDPPADLDLNSKDDSFREEILFPDLPVIDLGRVDERFMGRDTRYGFTSFADPSKPFDSARAGNVGGRVTNSYGVFDLKDGTMKSYFAGPTHSLAEVTFVPRSKTASEGDGWLIGTANNLAEMRTELIIADAQRPQDGDIARVTLPFRPTSRCMAAGSTMPPSTSVSRR